MKYSRTRTPCLLGLAWPDLAWVGLAKWSTWAEVLPQVARCGRNTNYIHQAVTTEPEPEAMQEDAAAST